MDSRTLLDYALFQLTPTRTRCDLVIFSGNKSEKLASGMLEPFLTHLQSAKDQISKGGYSIILRPPTDSSWFTKATLERFVRFISTPEVLERFVTIETEIDQIENSIELNEQANRISEPQVDRNPSVPVAPYKSGLGSNDSGGDKEQEEKPSVCMLRALESRKAILKKEQAMAYARAFASGFQMDSIYDLVSFSDAFGAPRLRDACMNFIILCNKKNEDKIWMDEVAAMQRYSHSDLSYSQTPGLMLVGGENNNFGQNWIPKTSRSHSITSHETLDTDEGTDSSLHTESNTQQRKMVAQFSTWSSRPAYMQHGQSPMFQQIPPYPGYMFQGMPFASSYNPNSMPWNSNFHDLDKDMNEGQRYSSFVEEKERSLKHIQENNRKHDKSMETDTSYSSEKEHESSRSSSKNMHNKRHGKESSREVVIRNLNYIASSRDGASKRGSSDENEEIVSDSSKREVEIAVGSLKKHFKTSSRKTKAKEQVKKSRNRSIDGLDTENIGTASEEKNEEENWDMFQNILLRDIESTLPDTGSKAVDVQEEYSRAKADREKSLSKQKYASDAFLLSEKSTDIGSQASKVESSDDLDGVVTRSKDEELFISTRAEGAYYAKNSHIHTESSITKSQKEEEWLKGRQSEISASPVERINDNIFCDLQTSTDHFRMDKDKKKAIFIDDSFMVKSQPSDGPLETHQPMADVIMVSEIIGVNQSKNILRESVKENIEFINFTESDDVRLLVRRDSAAEQVTSSWIPEMDRGTENIRAENIRMTETSNSVDPVPIHNRTRDSSRFSKKPGQKPNANATKSKSGDGSLGRSKSDLPLRSKIPPSGSRTIRSKPEKEEENRRKMEELAAQRQKRIAERSSAKGSVSRTSMKSVSRTSMKSPKERTKNTVSGKTEMVKPKSSIDEDKSSQKPVIRSSTITRLASPWTIATKKSPTESKVVEKGKPAPKETVAKTSSLMKRMKGNPPVQHKVNPSDKRTSINKSKGNASEVGQNRKTAPKVTTSTLKTTKGIHQRQAKVKSSDKKIGPSKSIGDSYDTRGKNCDEIVSFVPHKPTIVEGTLFDNKVKISETAMESSIKLPETNKATEDENHSKILSLKDLRTSENPSTEIKQQGNASDNVQPPSQTTLHSIAEVNFSSTAMKLDRKGDKEKKCPIPPEVRKVHFSMPPLITETDMGMIHNSKKRDDGESSPKAFKGFRKLIFFGRRI